VTEVRARGLPWGWLAGAVAFLGAAMLLGLAVGPARIGLGALVDSILSNLPFLDVHSHLSTAENAIVWQLRAPRVVLAALVGGMLAIAGSAYQGVFRNPLADPYLLGVAAGAGLGATVAIGYISAGTGWVPIAAFVGAGFAVAGTYAIGRSVGGTRTTGTLILAGVTMATFLASAQTFVLQQRSENLKEIYAWLLGGFVTADWHDVWLAAPYVAGGSAVILLHGRVLDVLSLGDDEASALGMNVRRARLVVIAAATVGTAAAVAVSGLIAFVGIIVPHTVRLLVSTSYRAVVPLSLVVGGGFMVAADVLARTVLSPQELPIGVVTAIFGAPFFAVVLRLTRTVDV
jgi:iron complex transport system permease protein